MKEAEKRFGGSSKLRTFVDGNRSEPPMRAIDIKKPGDSATNPTRQFGGILDISTTPYLRGLINSDFGAVPTLQDIMRSRGVDTNRAEDLRRYGCAIDAVQSAFGARATFEEENTRLATVRTVLEKLKDPAADKKALFHEEMTNIRRFYHELPTHNTELGQAMRGFRMSEADLTLGQVRQALVDGGENRRLLLVAYRGDINLNHIMHLDFDPKGRVISRNDPGATLDFDPNVAYSCFIFDKKDTAFREGSTLLLPVTDRSLPRRLGSESVLIAGNERALSRHIFTDLQAPILPKETIELLKMHESKKFRTERQKFFWNMLANYLPDRYRPPQKGPVTVLVPACGNFEEAPVLEALIGCGDFGSIHENVHLIGVDSDPYAIGKAIGINSRTDPETGIPHLPLNYSIIHGNAADLDHTPGVPDKANLVLLRHPNLGLAPFFWPQIFEQSVKRLEDDSIMLVTTYYENESIRAKQLLTELGCEVEVKDERNPFAKPLRFPNQIDDNFVLIARKKKE